jgi:cell division protein FtsL
VALPAPGIALPRRRQPRPTVQLRRRPAGRTAQQAPGIALRAIGALDGISSSSVFDRLIRGRLWIGLLAFALIGIVAMQLLVLQLNTGIGHTLGRVAQLQRQNAQLGIEDSTYSAESRVAPLAAAAGMTLAPAGTVHFVAASSVDVSHAAVALSTAAQAPAGGESTGTEGGEATASQSSAATTETAGSPESSSSSSATSSQGSAATTETAASAESPSSTSGPQE